VTVGLADRTIKHVMQISWDGYQNYFKGSFVCPWTRNLLVIWKLLNTSNLDLDFAKLGCVFSDLAIDVSIAMFDNGDYSIIVRNPIIMGENIQLFR